MRYEATQGFDHDATGHRSRGDVFDMADSALGDLLIGQGVVHKTTKAVTVILPQPRRPVALPASAEPVAASASAKRKPGPKPGAKRSSKTTAKAKPAAKPTPSADAPE